MIGRSTKTLLAAGTVLLLVTLTGCTDSSPSGAAGPTASLSPSEVVTRALSDVEQFWTTTYPTISDGKPFEPIRGGYHPYTQSSPPPACGGQEGEYQPNAFYCPDGDFIAWDAEKLIPELQSQFGQLLVALVMAHEYGHAIQTRLGVTGQPTVVMEQQADCYAGAWLADAMAGHAGSFTGITPAQIDSALAGMLQLRDQPGTSATNEGAHGNAFDRIRALQDGVQNGASKCAGYNSDNLPITEVPFTQQQDLDNGGNLPYAQAVDTIVKGLEAYWTKAYPQLSGGKQWKALTVQPYGPASPPACPNPDSIAGGAAFYCPDGDFIAYDDQRLQQLYEQDGDNAVGLILGDLYARAAQHRRGVSTDGSDGQLAVDCLNGSWTYDLLHPATKGDTQLSPGDLDEAVAALLALGRATGGSGASGFDRIASYRKGVLNGLNSCR